jgi:eukaryotic-like serine/threonine-protein kinase
MREVNTGDQLDQYEVGELLARSGMASIFKAVDTASPAGQVVALKVPHMQFESDVVFFERFKREEKIGQRLDHPNIVKVLQPREKSRMYLAMEHVEGRSLRAMLQSGGPLPVATALDIARQVCEALVYLHAQKVIHRDIKPENVLLTATGQVKILDFGIALDESARRLTWAGLSAAIGTPDYMAPEQIGGRRGDERTDVYAVGTMLFEMLTGQLPHTAPNPHALMRAKTNDDPKPPSYYLPSIDPALEAIILRAIARVPRDRQATVAELLAHLRDPGAAPPPADESPTSSGGARVWHAARRRALPVAAFLILGGLIALIALSNRRAPGAGGASPGVPAEPVLPVSPVSPVPTPAPAPNREH